MSVFAFYTVLHTVFILLVPSVLSFVAHYISLRMSVRFVSF